MSRPEIDAEVDLCIQRFYGEGAYKKLANKCKGALVFPSILKGGLLGFGGSYGKGALMIDGKVDGYYSTVSASFGFQLGVQAYSMIMLFLTEPALKDFQNSEGWQAGVDASVAVLEAGIGTGINTDNIKASVVAFIFDNAGLMYSLDIHGTKISRLSDD